jgi:hypothetical protein
VLWIILGDGGGLEIVPQQDRKASAVETAAQCGGDGACHAGTVLGNVGISPAVLLLLVVDRGSKDKDQKNCAWPQKWRLTPILKSTRNEGIAWHSQKIAVSAINDFNQVR